MPKAAGEVVPNQVRSFASKAYRTVAGSLQLTRVRRAAVGVPCSSSRVKGRRWSQA
ncbi:MAG: hypothetical protein U0133_17510 [Gemmatimonadales bacterium]